jgi:ParB family transcriptional regulator, chromosome partitioning protein
MRLLHMPKRPEMKGLGVQLLRNVRSDDSHPVETFTNDIDPAKVINLPLTSITPNPDQPRKYFDDVALEGLADSIRQRGLLQPVVVRKVENSEDFTLIAGERRWRAAQIAGLRKIPALVRQHEDPLELALIENLQRQDLRPLDEAEALLALKERQDLTDILLAKIVGKSRSTVTELLTLNQLPNSIKEECRTSDKYQKSNLLQVVRQENEEAQLSLWTKIKAGNLSVQDTRKLRKERTTRNSQGYEFKYQPPESTYIVRIKFRKSQVTQADVASALQQALQTLIP